MSINNNVDLIDIEENKISPSAKIYSGCRLLGNNTSIDSNCILGEEGPVILDNCQLGRGVRLKGGYFKNSVFLNNSSIGSGAHIRGGTLLEEYSSAAHCVGFKQTILFPYVTAGSLINFCDAFISGGTDIKNHSEIGSSYIHFNYTLNQDKATPSIFGNISDGIFLNENPIFLGGQGGSVGPIQLAFGSKVAAGSILRNDYLKKNQIISEPHIKKCEKNFIHHFISDPKKIIKNNLNYLGTLNALYCWYSEVRSKYIKNEFDQRLIDGAKALLIKSFEYRLKHFKHFYTDNLDKNISYLNIDDLRLINDFSFNSTNLMIKTDNYINDIKNIDSKVMIDLKKSLSEIINNFSLKIKE
ncbi:MAG: hypothetical protein ACJ0BW_01555 [Pontiellaceae bacterium]